MNTTSTINTVKTTEVPAHKLAYGDIYIGNKECGSDAYSNIVNFVENLFGDSYFDETGNDPITVVHFIDGSLMEADSSAACDVMGRVEQFTYEG